MKIYYIIVLLFTTILFAMITGSCNDDLQFEQINEIPVDFSIGINYGAKYDSLENYLLEDKLLEDSKYFTITTRSEQRQPVPLNNLRTAWGTATQSTIWVAGDNVGIYMMQNSALIYSNVPYTATVSDKVTPLKPVSSPLFFPDKTTPIDILAYYPYASGPNGPSPVRFANSAAMKTTALNYVLPVDQTLASTITGADLMYATAQSAVGDSPNVNLFFNHAMTLISFRIKSESLDGKKLSKVILSGRSITNTGVLDLKNLTMTLNTLEDFSPYSNINQTLDDEDQIFIDFIINPCVVRNNSTGVQLKATFVVNGKSYTTNLVNSAIYSPGSRYIYTITVKD